MNVICVYCGSETQKNLAYRHVEGWERERTQGGTNALSLRKASNNYACWSCISARKHAQTEGQEALWG